MGLSEDEKSVGVSWYVRELSRKLHDGEDEKRKRQKEKGRWEDGGQFPAFNASSPEIQLPMSPW